MKTMFQRRTRVSGLVAVVALFSAGATLAQAPGIKRTILQRSDVGGNMEVILGSAEIASGGATGRHTHFGVETGYVLSGTSLLEVEGEAPRNLKAGDSYLIPAGKVHNATAKDGDAKVLATYVVEKGKPLATPAP
jgi:quercetin dioxygenase-like cupin family protein